MIKLLKGVQVLSMAAMLLLSSACSSILPRAEDQTVSPWQSFDEVSADFDQIEAGETTVEQLGELGFNPKVTPNITRITYVDLLARFLPNPSITLNDVDPAVSQCIKAREVCYGLSLAPGRLDRQRYGNALLDIFGFKRRTEISGWRFDGLVVIHDDLVVYKLSGGNPNITELEYRKRPLGPLQEINIRGSVDI